MARSKFTHRSSYQRVSPSEIRAASKSASGKGDRKTVPSVPSGVGHFFISRSPGGASNTCGSGRRLLVQGGRMIRCGVFCEPPVTPHAVARDVREHNSRILFEIILIQTKRLSKYQTTVDGVSREERKSHCKVCRQSFFLVPMLPEACPHKTSVSFESCTSSVSPPFAPLSLFLKGMDDDPLDR